ncbi:MAG: LysM peptidoglycan-binding domain-containing protein [Anaerolineae bacterium]|nr:LysM peptidoglycan-binding domain-containing protein [Anaerolineae bacterium]
MTNTRGNLKPATITTVDNSVTINCMFNPENYTVVKKNSFNTEQKTVIPIKPEFKQYGRSTLTLSELHFDVYETGGDLTATTNKLWDLMSPTDAEDPNSSPPEVKFKWGSFQFTAVIESLTVKYTLFDKDGEPLRSVVTITFIQSDNPNTKPHQNPTSGGGPVQEVRKIISGDRLDLIAADVYGDATKWRLIAEYNHIHNPKALRPGQSITIPPLQ